MYACIAFRIKIWEIRQLDLIFRIRRQEMNSSQLSFVFIGFEFFLITGLHSNLKDYQAHYKLKSKNIFGRFQDEFALMQFL